VNQIMANNQIPMINDDQENRLKQFLSPEPKKH